MCTRLSGDTRNVTQTASHCAHPLTGLRAASRLCESLKLECVVWFNFHRLFRTGKSFSYPFYWDRRSGGSWFCAVAGTTAPETPGLLVCASQRSPGLDVRACELAPSSTRPDAAGWLYRIHRLLPVRAAGGSVTRTVPALAPADLGLLHHTGFQQHFTVVSPVQRRWVSVQELTGYLCFFFCSSLLPTY